MTRSDLPREFSGPLDFAELLATMGFLHGERIGVELLRDGGGLSSHVVMAGTLEPVSTPAVGGAWFSIGDAARLALFEHDFRAAHLLTYDGNDGFHLTVELQQGSLTLGDAMITAAELFMHDVE